MNDSADMTFWQLEGSRAKRFYSEGVTATLMLAYFAFGMIYAMAVTGQL